MRERRLTLRLDEETSIALRRLSQAEERSMAAQVRIMVRLEAQRKGLWEPSALQAIRAKNQP